MLQRMKMKKEKIMNKVQDTYTISSQEIKELCYKIAQEIAITQKNYDYIVGINRGGIIPLGYLSYFLNNRNTKILDISLYGDDEEPDTSHEKIQLERKKVIEFLSDLKKEKKDQVKKIETPQIQSLF